MKVCSVCKRCFNDDVLSCEKDGHPPLAGTRAGDLGAVAGYTIETLVESNVGGETYRARHDESRQPCLVRVAAAEPEEGLRFLDDARLAAKLFHANVADVYEAGELQGGIFYVVTEASDSETLRDVLNTTGPPTLLDSVRIIRQTAEALHAVHLKGMAHRALRPENIRLVEDGEEGQVRVAGIDFGALDEQGIISNKFLIDGAIDSIRYFAPEQCTGEGGSPSSDVYALGIVLYEMLAGVPPFEATKATALIAMHVDQRPPEIRIENFDLRMLLTHTISEALQKKASFRQCSADLFARQMRHIEQLATHVSTPPPAVNVPGTPQLNFAAARVQATPPAFRVPEPAEEPRPEITQHSGPKPIAFDEPIVENEPHSIDQSDRDRIFAAVAVFDETEVPQSFVADTAMHGEIDEGPVPMPTTKIDSNLEPKPEPVKRRSRLKLKKKQLHSLVAAAPLAPIEEMARTRAEHPEAIKPLEVEMGPLPVPEIAARPLPRKVVGELPEDDVPSLDDIMELLEREPIPLGVSPEPVIKTDVEPNPIMAIPGRGALVGIEEVTADSPPRKAINVERQLAPRAQRSVISTVEFAPTLLSNGAHAKATMSEQDLSIFGTYRIPPTSRFVTPYRAMAAGGLAVLVSLLFLAGKSAGWLGGSESGVEETITTTTKPHPAPREVMQADISQTEQPRELIKPVRAFQEPVKETYDVEPIVPKQASLKTSQPVEANPPKPVTPRQTVKSPIVPTTRVIVTENGKTTSKIVATAEKAERSIAPKKTAGSTRPRIVGVPD